MDAFIKKGNFVLVLWLGQPDEKYLTLLISSLSTHVGENGKVQCQNLSRLETGEYVFFFLF